MNQVWKHSLTKVTFHLEHTSTEGSFSKNNNILLKIFISATDILTFKKMIDAYVINSMHCYKTCVPCVLVTAQLFISTLGHLHIMK